MAALGLILSTALALPWLLSLAGLDYYQSLASRIIVYAIAATSLNLVLGLGGMVSLGHAAFFGLGAYATGVLIAEGIANAAWHVAASVALAGLAAAVIGAISLRTRGVYFIMITLAFAQMLFYLANSSKAYGGDEGLTLRTRSALPVLGLDLKNGLTLYYSALAALVLLLWALIRFIDSPAGRAVRAVRDDELRAEALGFAAFGLKLAVFVAGGMLAGLAGALYMNLQGYVNPNVLYWTQSGSLLVMVIIGGVGTVYGGVVGAATLIGLQELFGGISQYAEFWTGWVLLAIVLFARHGLVGLLPRQPRR